MDQIAIILQQLANKLGTTTEYLWGVLLKQAPISAVIDIIQYIIIGLACWVWHKITKKVHDSIDKGDSDEINYAWVVIGWVTLVPLVIIAFFNISDTITALINPEYWALDTILGKINR